MKLDNILKITTLMHLLEKSKNWREGLKKAQELWHERWWFRYVVVAILVLFLGPKIFEYGTHVLTRKEIVVHHQNPGPIKGGRVLGTGPSMSEQKSKKYATKFKELEETNKSLFEENKKLMGSVVELAERLDKMETNKTSTSEDKTPQGTSEKDTDAPKGVSFEKPLDDLSTTQVSESEATRSSLSSSTPPRPRARNRLGPSVISFPVETKENGSINEIKIPAGSFVKATLLTGVEAPEGRALPALLKADYAFIGPNKTRVDLTGCFFIGKSTGNLSIERVELQVVKLSCVARSGRFFERDINGFVADAKDNSFAITGTVNGKKNRVAALAFLSSIVEGLGRAVQQSQTTTETNAVGGSSSLITGDQARYLAAGGAATAANRITEFYLKHAESLLPTINVGSGSSVFIIVQDTLGLPDWYFKKASEKSSDQFSYLSRVLE